MISRVHQKLGTAGFIISIVALVAALGGGAYAAGGLTKSQEKQVVKLAKKYAGKNGTNGAPGAAGTKGDAGAPGAAGAAGKQGPEGKQGPKGEEGPEGEEGSPWTAGGTLPAGATETGAWVLNTTAASTSAYISLSFPIRLSGSLATNQVHYVTVAEQAVPPPGSPCSGEAPNPTAAASTLCVYEGAESEGAKFKGLFTPTLSENGAGVAGALLSFKEVGAEALMYGSWAVGGS